MYFGASQIYSKISPSGLNFPSQSVLALSPTLHWFLEVKAISGSPTGCSSPTSEAFWVQPLVTQGTLGQGAASVFSGQHSCPVVTVTWGLTVSSLCHPSVENCFYKMTSSSWLSQKQYYSVQFHAFAKSAHQILKILIHACIYHNMNQDIWMTSTSHSQISLQATNCLIQSSLQCLFHPTVCR